MFVDLVDAGVGRPEFDHLRTDLRDETSVRSATGSGQLGVDAGFDLDGGGDGIAQRAARRQERPAAYGPGQGVFQAMFVEDGVHPLLQTFDAAGGGKAEVEIDDDFAGNHIGSAGAAVDVRHLPGGRQVVFIGLIPFFGGQFRQRRRRQVDRVFRQLRISDMALYAFHRELAGHGAAAAVFDHVAQRRAGGRFADDAVIKLLAARLEFFADDHGAVGSRAFFIAGDQESDGAGVVRAGQREFFHRHHHRCNRGFHVRRAAAVQLAVAVAGPEGIGLPLLARTGRHHVGVAGKHQQRPRRAFACPQVGDVARLHGFAGKTERRQQFDQERLAAFVLRRDGRQGNQLFGQRQGFAMVAHCSCVGHFYRVAFLCRLIGRIIG